MIGILVDILIFCLIAGLIWWVITMIPLPPPFALIVRVVFAVICVIFIIELLLSLVGTGGGLGFGGFGGNLGCRPGLRGC
jgi:hypothetical protein